jgi:hypothetical protein
MLRARSIVSLWSARVIRLAKSVHASETRHVRAMQTSVWAPFVIALLLIPISRVLIESPVGDLGKAAGHLLAAVAAIPLIIGLYRLARWARGA